MELLIRAFVLQCERGVAHAELDISGPDGYSFGFPLRHVLSHLSSCAHDTYRGTAIEGRRYVVVLVMERNVIEMSLNGSHS